MEISNLENAIKIGNSMPSNLNNFQRLMYSHLMKYKKEVLKIEEFGILGKIAYETRLTNQYDNILPLFRDQVRNYFQIKGIKEHIHFPHLASSQAACLNLFMPLKLNQPLANQVLPKFLPDFETLVNIEFEYHHEDDYLNEGKGFGIKRTDSDVAVFYRNPSGEKCLCLIEHKLSEPHFSCCNAYKSPRNNHKDKCLHFNLIWNDPNLCYYQFKKNYSYWKLTRGKNTIFDQSVLGSISESCPFINSLQQLWRNQLMAAAIENAGKEIKRTYFAVIYHGENNFLWDMPAVNGIAKVDLSFMSLLADNSKFFTFTIQDVIKTIRVCSIDTPIWVQEYEAKYLNIH